MDNTQNIKIYKKKTKAISKDCSKNKAFGLFLFIEYLKYIKNLLTIEALREIKNESTKTKISAISIAIAEFDAYISYGEAGNSEQKNFHWNNFCELIKYNMEEWIE